MKHRFSYLKNNVFLKYLLSYTLVFLIPLTVMGFIMYSYFINIYEKEVIQSNIDMIEKIKNNVDVQISQTYKIAMQLGREKFFSREYMNSNTTYFNDIASSLSSTRNFNEFIHDILFYRQGTDSIYSSLYLKCNLDIYLNNICTYKDWKPDDFKYAVNQSAQSFWRGSEAILDVDALRQVITYVGPNKDNDATILVQIDTAKLNSIMKSIYSDTGKTLIVDNQGDLIFSSPGNGILDESLLNRIKGMKADSAYLADKNLVGNHIYYTRSSVTGFNYIREIPLKYALQRVFVMRRIIFTVLSGLFLLGTILIYILAKFNYKPIHQLGEAARSFFPDIPGKPNDIETSKYVMESLLQLNRDIVTESQKPFKEYMVLKLLKGTYDHPASFNLDGKRLGMELAGDFYRVAIFVLSESAEDTLTEYFHPEAMENMFQDSLKAYFIDGIERYSLISVFFGTSMGNIDLQEYLKHIFSKLPASSKNIKVGIGKEVRSLKEIFNSYNEAKIALKYNSPVSHSSIVFYKDSALSNELSFIYPKAELEMLNKSIEDGNPAKVEFIVEDLIRLMKTEKTSYFISVCLGFDIINTIIKAVHKLGLEFSDFLYKKLDMASLQELSNIEDITDNIRSVSSEVCTFLLEKSVTNPSGLSGKALSYIQQNISDPNLSIQSVSDMLGMSLSNLSHQFKKETGENLSELINRYRMEKAKELLRHTGKSLAEIGNLVGYSQVTSFVRKFKQSENITPGEYRKLYGSKT